MRLRDELKMIVGVRRMSCFFFFSKMEMQSFALIKYIKTPWQKIEFDPGNLNELKKENCVL